MLTQDLEISPLALGGNVIPFRRPQPPMPPDPLQLALRALATSLEEQRIAVAAWRAALGELRESVQSLGSSLQSFRRNLDELAGGVATLNAEAVRMQDF